MSWSNLHVDDFGQVGKLTCKEDGSAVDISSYTTLQMVLTDPSGVTAVKSASFDSDGTNGIIKYTILDGDIDEEGHWKVQARISKTGSEITSDPLEFYIESRSLSLPDSDTFNLLLQNGHNLLLQSEYNLLIS